MSAEHKYGRQDRISQRPMKIIARNLKVSNGQQFPRAVEISKRILAIQPIKVRRDWKEDTNRQGNKK